ncbi:MAG: DNA repair protein RecN [Clostridia bacterium]|nr:DNA repair protein RecN [Clostridia bacterium]
MIKRLELKNIALINHAIIDFEKGLNVLSGETGSGKSVIVDSINFVLGAKADKSMIRHGENECYASVTFDVSKNVAVTSILEDLGCEAEDEIIVSRKFTSDSKSAIRVNGVPFTLGMLRQITSVLVYVHGQSEHYSLMKKSEQLNVLDKFCDKELLNLKEQLKGIVKTLKEIDLSLEDFGGSESERAIRADVLKFQIDEIESVNVQGGEEDELVLKKKKIQSAEKIAEGLSTVKSAINGDGCISDIIGEAIRKLSAIANFDEKYEELYNRLKETSVELYDLGETSDDYLSEIDFSESEADEIESRLDKIKAIKRKYGNTVEEINEFLQDAKTQYEKIVNFDVEYQKLLSKKQKSLLELKAVYDKITTVRKKSAKVFEERVLARLRQLAMKDASFEVGFATVDFDENSYSQNGNDSIEFMFSANLGEPKKPLSKIISGGEMSRFMLALKAITSEYQTVSTYIFDEIDVGISGNTAVTVAENFADLSKNIQVIAISHLPQICAFSDCSFQIAKSVENGKTVTNVNKLSPDEKIAEIVRIIGGTGSSDGAMLHAKEIIKYAEDYKTKK